MLLVPQLTAHRVVSVKCAAAFSVALCKDSRAYSWGIAENEEMARPACKLRVSSSIFYSVNISF
jgi:alpha-tubulin suppressor-like RCC1 family protein